MGRIEKMGLLLFMLAWPTTLAYIVNRETIPEWSMWVVALLTILTFTGLMVFLISEQEIRINIQE